jgi:hypothetical protein
MPIQFSNFSQGRPTIFVSAPMALTWGATGLTFQMGLGLTERRARRAREIVAMVKRYRVAVCAIR